ncbi:MAG: MopE-related protein [Myxococcales bacterium]
MRKRLWTLLLCVGIACGGSDKSGGRVDDDSDAAMPDGSVGPGDGDGGTTGDGDGDADGGDGGNTLGFACLGMDAIAVSTLVDNSLQVNGRLIGADASLVLRALDSASADLSLPADEVQGDAAAVFTLHASALPAGLYAVDLTSGGVASPCGTLGVSPLAPPSVSSVTPDSAHVGVVGDGVLSDRTVVITGSGFQDAPSVLFVKRGDAKQRFLGEQVSFVSAGQITVVVPSESLGMALGDYDVIVINPDGLRGTWSNPFHIVADPPPQITNVDPFRGAQAASVAVTITGKHFAATAVAALDVNGVLKPLPVTSRTDDTQIKVTISGSTLGLAIGSQYPLRVTNPDGQFDVYFAYSVSASSEAKLDGFANTGVNLAVGRYRLASAVGFDAASRGYIYVGGGIDASGNVLGNLEAVEVSGLGLNSAGSVLQQWGSAAQPRVSNNYVTARAGHSMVRVGRYLYALGGASANTHVATPSDAALLASVERAKILDFKEQPAIFTPQALGGSGLPLGNWYYRVSALGAWGESLPSREIQLLQTSGSVRVCWSGVEGATSYNLYRSPASDGRAGTTRLAMTEIVGSMENGGVRCAVDDGKGGFRFAPGRLRGIAKTAADTGAAGAGLAVGHYLYRVTATIDGVETAAGYRAFVSIDDVGTSHVALRWDPVVGATYTLYRTKTAFAGAPQGNEATFRIATGLTDNQWIDDGTQTPDAANPAPDGIRALTPGSLSRFQTLPQAMPEAREGLDAVAATLPRVDRSGTPTVVGLTTYIYAAGGRSATTVDKADVYLSGVLRIAVDGATGDLDQAGFVNAGTTHAMKQKRAFFPLLTNIGQRDDVRAPQPEEPPCEENDGDGYLPARCGGDDCNDNDVTIHPDAVDRCGDGIDQDCDGQDPSCDAPPTCPRDVDGDGAQPAECGGCDCDDNNPTIHCGAVDVCGDGVDQDCQGGDAACGGCVDGDNDGKLSVSCGGCDCDDGNAMIACGLPESCEATPELCDDGVDQDCSGSDCSCAIVLFAGTVDASQDLSSYDPNQIVLLIAVAGDDTYNSGSNDGTNTFEVTGVSTLDGSTHGDIVGWELQDNHLNNGSGTLGHDAVLYFDYLFPFPGVQDENRSVAGTPNTSGVIAARSSTSGRWPFDETPPGNDQSLYTGGFQSSSTGFETARTYYTSQRINGGVFTLGGHSGSAVLNSVERTIP